MKQAEDMTRAERDELEINKKCGAPAHYIYQWPGIYGTYACQEHFLEIKKVAERFELEMQYEPLEADDKQQCEKIVINNLKDKQ